MPSIPPAPPSIPPPRATIHSIAPTALDIEADSAPLPPLGEVAVDFRPRESKGMFLFGGLAALALAFAGVWSQTAGGPLASAAGAGALSALELRPVHLSPAHDTAIPPAPTGHGMPELGEPGLLLAAANGPARQLERNDPAVRYNAPEAYRTRTTAVRSIRKSGGESRTPSVVIAQPGGSDKAVEWSDAPRMGYETTVVGEFAGKI
jgi:hypothetical protein